MRQFVNDQDGMPIVYAEIPEDYQIRARLTIQGQAMQHSYSYQGEAQSPDQKIYLYFRSAQTYKFDKTGMNGQSMGDAIIHPLCSLQDQMDEIIQGMVNKPTKRTNFYPFSTSMQQCLQNQESEGFQKLYQELTQLVQMQGNQIQIQMGNAFLDGGVGEYETEDNLYYVGFYRTGSESLVQDVYYGRILANDVTWTIPYTAVVSCSKDCKEKGYEVCSKFVESFQLSQELLSLDQQFKNETFAYSNQMYQQNQQFINQMWQNHNARWDAVERQRDMLSKDMDEFRANLNASMASNDAFRESMHQSNTSFGGMNTESLDDRIQRMRHESMMGVNTYVNDEGHETEFSTMADRVFEQNSDNLSHFGTANYYDDYVPDGFTELNRKK